MLTMRRDFWFETFLTCAMRQFYQRVILYGFPIYLIVIEQVIRVLFGTEELSISVVASSACVGGMTLLLPLLVPAPIELSEDGLTAHTLSKLEDKGLSAYRSSDISLSISGWVFLVSLTFAWIFSLSHKAGATKVSILNMPEIIAIVSYFVGILHTEIKGLE